MPIQSIRYSLGTVIGAFVVIAGLGSPLGESVIAAQWNPERQAVDRCEQDLTYRLGSDSGARDPHSSLDDRSVNVQAERNSIRVTGRGEFRRDRFDAGRQFTFDCTVDTRSGNTRTNYRWGSDWDGTAPSYPLPPYYRPGASGGGSAYPPSGRAFYSGGIFSRTSGKSLDVEAAGTADLQNVHQWDFRNRPNQLWDVIDQGGGRFSIISQGSGKALDVANHQAADGTNVIQYRFHNGDNQLWRLRRVGDTWYEIVSVSSGKCLDVDANRSTENGANVQIWSCNRQPQQQWRLGR